MNVNQRGEAIIEEQLFDKYAEHTDGERDVAISLLCEHLGVELWRTNATKHGDFQIELRKGTT